MKTYHVLVLVWLLVGCSPIGKSMLPSERIVSFVTGDRIIWYGVKMNEDTILTATHVVESCQKWNCTFEKKSLSGIQIMSYADKSIIWDGGIDSINDWKNFTVWDHVYLLRYSSWQLRRYDTEITGLERGYIGVDASLSGTYLTWAIEISIALEKGESGLPVWTLSWELVWVVSATDSIAGKSYIVR